MKRTTAPTSDDTPEFYEGTLADGLDDDDPEAIRKRLEADRELRLRTIEDVLDLMDDAGKIPSARRPDTIYPHSNGYGCWFIDGQLGTAPLSPEEILGRIEAREKAGIIR